MRVGNSWPAARLRGVGDADVVPVGAVELTADRPKRRPHLHSVAWLCATGGIAQVIIHEPKLVVLDEPILRLDPADRGDAALVRTLAGKHTVIPLSHILSVQRDPWIASIKDGEIASGTEREPRRAFRPIALRAPGTSSAVLSLKAKKALGDVTGVTSVEDTTIAESSDEVAAFVVDAKQDVRPALATAAIGAGLELLELARLEHELESVFLRLAGNGAGATGRTSS
jgi:ABC-2 type transport system ATP-binding protein